MQYELMRYIAAAAHGCVTIVGDPDQSSEYKLNGARIKFDAHPPQSMAGAQPKSRTCLKCAEVLSLPSIPGC